MCWIHKPSQPSHFVGEQQQPDLLSEANWLPKALSWGRGKLSEKVRKGWNKIKGAYPETEQLLGCGSCPGEQLRCCFLSGEETEKAELGRWDEDGASQLEPHRTQRAVGPARSGGFLGKTGLRSVGTATGSAGNEENEEKWGKLLSDPAAPRRWWERCQFTATPALPQRADRSLYPPDNEPDKSLCRLGTFNSRESSAWINHCLFSDYPELMILHFFFF